MKGAYEPYPNEQSTASAKGGGDLDGFSVNNTNIPLQNTKTYDGSTAEFGYGKYSSPNAP